MAGRVRHSILLRKCSSAGMVETLVLPGEHFCILQPT